MLLLTNYIHHCILSDVPIRLRTIQLIPWTVYTVAHVPLYYIGLLSKNRICHLHISHLPRPDNKRSDVIYHEQRWYHVCLMSDLATVRSDPERVLHRATAEVGLKTSSFETMLPEPVGLTNKETAPSSMKRVLAAHTFTNADLYMSGNVIESGSNAIYYKPQLLAKSIVKPPSNMKSKTGLALANLGLLTKIDVEEIVESRLTKCTKTLQSQTLKSVEFTFEEELQSISLNSNDGLKSTMSIVVVQALSKIVRSGGAPRLCRAEIPSLIQKNM